MKRTHIKKMDTRLMAEANKQNYEKMMSVDRPKFLGHTRMSRKNRAFQFAPFAALDGLKDAFNEVERETDIEKELSEDICSQLDYTIQELLVEKKPLVKITYFRPDAIKPGGEYKEVVGNFLGLDRSAGKILLSENEEIPLEMVFLIEEVNYSI